jgi:hypothetical protein
MLVSATQRRIALSGVCAAAPGTIRQGAAMSHSSQPGKSLLVIVVVLVVLTSAGPALVALAQALVPLVIVGGIVVAVLRIVWHYTDHH